MNTHLHPIPETALELLGTIDYDLLREQTSWLYRQTTSNDEDGDARDGLIELMEYLRESAVALHVTTPEVAYGDKAE